MNKGRCHEDGEPYELYYVVDDHKVEGGIIVEGGVDIVIFEGLSAFGMAIIVGIHIESGHDQEELAQVAYKGPRAEDLLSLRDDLGEVGGHAVELEVVRWFFYHFYIHRVSSSTIILYKF